MTSTEHSSSSSVPSACVLVVGDNDPVRRMLRVALQTAGFAVVEAGTQLELQRRLIDGQPDALLLDLHRSAADALDLLTRIRARQTFGNLPILFLAGCEDGDFRWQAIFAGADWFGLRPVGLSELRMQVADLVRNGRPTTHGESVPRSTARIIRLKPTG